MSYDIETAINLVRGIFPIPVLGNVLYHKIKESLYRIACAPELYLPYIDSGLGSEFLKELEFEDIHHDPGYVPFKLFGLSDSLWIPITSDKGVNPFLIVPEPIIEYIVKKSDKNPGLMFMEKKITVSELPGMKFEISFERDTAKPLISGIIKERNGKRVEDKSVDIDKMLYEGGERLKEIQEMNKAMLSDEEYYWYIITEFRRYWKSHEIKKPAASSG